MKLNWIKTNDYLQASTSGFKFKKKLAMFDLDSTLIIPKIGKKFPIDENDWKFQFKTVPEILQSYHKKDYSIIIISNQGGMSKGKQTFEVWSKKLNSICESLNVELYVFCSVDHNKYRKPYPTWFEEFIPIEIKESINRRVSFYCGDACGRKDDFSDTDYKFALNCMIKFKTPENMFLGKISKIPKILYPNLFEKKVPENLNFTPSNNKEIIIMVGFPGSGKSFISKEISTKYNYKIVNQDTLKSKEKCLDYINKYIKESKSIIIDQTNPDINTRKKWIDLAKKNSYTLTVILMKTSRELSKHNNYYRYLTTGKNLVPEIAYRIYNSKFQSPELNEGIDRIFTTEPNKPKNFYYYYYLY